jgi:hypothetical protein
MFPPPANSGSPLPDAALRTPARERLYKPQRWIFQSPSGWRAGLQIARSNCRPRAGLQLLRPAPLGPGRAQDARAQRGARRPRCLSNLVGLARERRAGGRSVGGAGSSQIRPNKCPESSSLAFLPGELHPTEPQPERVLASRYARAALRIGGYTQPVPGGAIRDPHRISPTRLTPAVDCRGGSGRRTTRRGRRG